MAGRSQVQGLPGGWVWQYTSTPKEGQKKRGGTRHAQHLLTGDTLTEYQVKQLRKTTITKEWKDKWGNKHGKWRSYESKNLDTIIKVAKTTRPYQERQFIAAHGVGIGSPEYPAQEQYASLTHSVAPDRIEDKREDIIKRGKEIFGSIDKFIVHERLS